MSQQSEERLPESAPAGQNGLPTAQIIHLKTRSDLQRAIQLRAQESVERERVLDDEQRRPKPLKWLVITAIAAIPMVLTLTAVDSFLRVFHKYMDVTATAPQGEQVQYVEPEANVQSQPGVVMLQPLSSPGAPAQSAAAPAQPVGQAQ